MVLSSRLKSIITFSGLLLSLCNTSAFAAVDATYTNMQLPDNSNIPLLPDTYGIKPFLPAVYSARMDAIIKQNSPQSLAPMFPCFFDGGRICISGQMNFEARYYDRHGVNITPTGVG